MMIMLWMAAEVVEGFAAPLAMSLNPSNGMKIIVCQGSSCAHPVPWPDFPGSFFFRVA